MEKLLDLEDLLQDVRDGNIALRVIGYAGMGQQADELEMGVAIQFVTKCLDDLLDQANKIFEEIKGEL